MLTILQQGVSPDFALGVYNELTEKLGSMRLLQLISRYDPDDVFGMIEDISGQLENLPDDKIFIYLSLHDNRSFQTLPEYEQSDFTDIFKNSKMTIFLCTS